MTAYLYKTPLGTSAREYFCQQIEANDDANAVLVLPNSALMKDVNQKHKGVQVMGMDTLANKILNMAGMVYLHEVSRRSQELVVQDLIAYLAEKDELDYFGELSKKPGFVKAMTALVGQLSRSGTSAEEINSIFSSWERQGTLGQKDFEVRRLYFFYRQYLKNNKWYDLEGKFRLAIVVLKEARYHVELPWDEIYFSDFATLNALQLEFMQELSKRVLVKVGMSFEPQREMIFTGSQNTVNALETFCKDASEITFVEEDGADSAGCKHLRNNLGGTAARMAQSEDVRIYSFGDRENEIRWVLSDVKKRLQNGAKESEILVAVHSLDKFNGLRYWADVYGIPVTLKSASSLATQPLAQFLQLLHRAAAYGRDGATAYMELLQSSLGKIMMQADTEVFNQERNRHYFTGRQQVDAYIEEHFPNIAQDDVFSLCREYIESIPHEATVAEYVAQLLALIEQLALEPRLGTAYKEGRVALQNVAVCLDARNKIVQYVQGLANDYEACGHQNDRLSLSEWTAMLTEVLAVDMVEISAGRRDGVTLTTAINAQGLHYDYVYIMGLNEGEFPSVGNENWIYNDKERGELKSMGLDLPNVAQEYAENAYIFAATAASAKKQLTLSYNEDVGEPSAYVDMVAKLFVSPDLKDGEQKQQQAVRLSVLQKAPAALEEAYRLGPVLSEAWLQDQLGETCLAAAGADAMRAHNEDNAYNGCIADKELKKAVRKAVGRQFSASMLETYAGCPFRYLGERVWRSEEFAEMAEEVQPADEGSLLHDVLAAFIGNHLQEKLTKYPIADLREELLHIFAETSARYIEEGSIVNPTLWQAEEPRLSRLLSRWLAYEYDEQAAWADFTPQATEWDFSARNGKMLPLTLSDGSEVSLRGRIDRLDGDGTRIVVTDYKRSKAPSASDVDNGLDLQLPLYMLAAAKLYKRNGQVQNVAGGSYFVLKDGVRKSPFLLEDVGNANLVSKKKNDERTIDDSWESFADFCEATLRTYIENMYDGQFPARPNPKCDDYCTLKGICRLREMHVQAGGEDDE